MASFTLRPLYRRLKVAQYPLDRRLGGHQSRSGGGEEEKNSQPPPGIKPPNPDHPAHSQSLYRLSYLSSYKSNVKMQLLTCPRGICEVSGSNLSSESGYHKVYMVSLSHSRQVLG
jgi:hypothetical protein